MTEVAEPKPLPPGRATELVRAKVNRSLNLWWAKHAKKQMKERDLLMGDVLHLLKHGFIYDEGISATQAGFFKYRMECNTPNSNGRTVRVVLIPSTTANEIKIITVMWRDER